MRRLILLFITLLTVLCCQDKNQDSVEVKEIKLFISNQASSLTSVSFTLYAFDGDLHEYDRWGVVYSESADKTAGEQVPLQGSPADKKITVELDDLKENTAYHVWGWAEGDRVPRLWTSHVTIRTLDRTKLSGTPIGSMSGKWAGADLGDRCVIKRFGYCPVPMKEKSTELAIIEGANSPDFSDALPIAMIKESYASEGMRYVDVDCSRGFRYVRYVAPAGENCNLSALEFYGLTGEGDDSQFCQLTNLPTVVINTEGAEEITSKENELSSTVYIISENGTDLLATQETGVRGRGNASWTFPKKPYRLKFKSKQSPLGAPASAKKWTLINNYGDKTLLRNIVAFEISRRVGQSYTPFCTPVDLVVNGEYRGCYQFCDQVEAAAGRVEAKDGYLIEIDAYASGEEVWFNSAEGMPVTIKHPDEDDITSEQRAFIQTYFNSMETTVFADNFTDPVTGYRKYLDLDSFLRNFIIGEFAGNTDTFWSVYMYKDSADGKLYTGPAWDYDLALENDKRTHPILSLSDYIYCTRGSVASSAVRKMVSRIVKEDPAAKERLVEIWTEACSEGRLSEINAFVSETASLLEESQRLNFMRWPILNEKVHQNIQALGSYPAEVQTVKNYLERRLEHFDGLVRK